MAKLHSRLMAQGVCFASFPHLYLCRFRDLVLGHLGATTIVKRQLSSPDWYLEQWGSAGSRAASSGGWGSQWILRLGASGTWLRTYLPGAPRSALGSRTPSRWNLRLGQQGASVANSTWTVFQVRLSNRQRGVEGWSSFQKQLSKCRVASILFAQHTVQPWYTLSLDRFGFETQHFSVPVFYFLLYPLHWFP